MKTNLTAATAWTDSFPDSTPRSLADLYTGPAQPLRPNLTTEPDPDEDDAIDDWKDEDDDQLVIDTAPSTMPIAGDLAVRVKARATFDKIIARSRAKQKEHYKKGRRLAKQASVELAEANDRQRSLKKAQDTTPQSIRWKIAGQSLLLALGLGFSCSNITRLVLPSVQSLWGSIFIAMSAGILSFFLHVGVAKGSAGVKKWVDRLAVAVLVVAAILFGASLYYRLAVVTDGLGSLHLLSLSPKLLLMAQFTGEMAGSYLVIGLIAATLGSRTPTDLELLAVKDQIVQLTKAVNKHQAQAEQAKGRLNMLRAARKEYVAHAAALLSKLRAARRLR